MFAWKSEILVTELCVFLLRLNTARHTVKSEVSGAEPVLSAKVVSVTPNHFVSRDEFHAQLGRGGSERAGSLILCKGSSQQPRYKEARIQQVKNVLTQKFQILEEARKRGNIHEDEVHGFGKRAREALQRVETSNNIQELQAVAVRAAVQEAKEAENAVKILSK